MPLHSVIVSYLPFGPIETKIVQWVGMTDGSSCTYPKLIFHDKIIPNLDKIKDMEGLSHGLSHYQRARLYVLTQLMYYSVKGHNQIAGLGDMPNGDMVIYQYSRLVQKTTGMLMEFLEKDTWGQVPKVECSCKVPERIMTRKYSENADVQIL